VNLPRIKKKAYMATMFPASKSHFTKEHAMPLPLFQHVPGYPFRVLPLGIYPCTPSDFTTTFRDQMPASKERQEIYTGFYRLVSRVNQYGVIAKIWLNGSFVTDKQDPGDIDVCFFLEDSVLQALSEGMRHDVLSVLEDAEMSRREYHVDAKR
jgi:hypothetical protein